MVRDGNEVAILAPEKRTLPGIKHYYVKPPQMGVFAGNPELPDVKRYEDMNGVELGEIYTTYVNATLAAVREFQPEIVHAFHTAFLPPVARMAKIMYGTRFVVTTHGSDLHYLSRDRRLVGVIRDSLNIAASITANSTFTRRWFLNMFGAQYERKIRTIPGGVYLDEYVADQKIIAEINDHYKLHGKKVVLFTGRLTPQKGVEYLIRAAPQIHGEVLVLGDGPDRPRLEKLIADLKVTNCHILGYMSPKEKESFKQFYARADVYVAPSTWKEPLGLVILEAMAARTPVISTRAGGVMSIIKDGYNGYLVHVRKAAEIATRVNELLDNDELREKMSSRAYDNVVKRYTWKVIAKQFTKIYRNYASNSKEYLRLVKATAGESGIKVK
jgi:glycosyltransferase involved in cell wall biosynthesis